MFTQTHAAQVLSALKAALTLPNTLKINHDPFETLIITIISQNTADTDTERAFQNLSKKFKITPQTLASAPLKEMEECLQIGGLYRSKAKTIQTASKIIVEKFGGSLKPILALPTEDARAALMDTHGVGQKTADVVLLFCANQPTVPVDTHVDRVSKRLGLAPEGSGYEEVRGRLQSLFEPEDYLSVHLLLILLGKTFCKARKTLCHGCPVNVYCPSNGRGEMA
ncbi:MAG: endonuclease III [Candidatus Bathyarchaeota archaeon]|nr:endonuclease III [Candidatus Bathyarchaeota archaeon]